MHAHALQSDVMSDDRLPVAHTIHSQSIQQWGHQQATEIVGVHASLATALDRVSRYARSEAPVLITGETGTGKELFARALYLLSARAGQPFVGVNCAQYQEGQLIASELFGHRRGSFTGATGDHKGIFESANGGVVFLDEVGELTLGTQAMLLRLIGEGEVVPVGETRARRVNVRLVVATNRPLKAMVEDGRFRADLYYRLRHLTLQLPPLRDRGGDWRLILDRQLGRLAETYRICKHFSPRALSLLEGYQWPGNVREVRGLVDAAYHMSDGEIIEPPDFLELLEGWSDGSNAANDPQLGLKLAATLYGKMTAREGTFWALVHEPYLERDLRRSDVRDLIAQGLAATRGSYKKLLDLFGVSSEDYLKFMDFLRHHKLKPAD